MNGGEELSAQAERLKAAGGLGRSPPIQKLFDYLLMRSLEGSAPKEIEVAEAVFGRTFDFDGRHFAILPGMRATASIVVERRTIAEWVFAPLFRMWRG